MEYFYLIAVQYANANGGWGTYHMASTITLGPGATRLDAFAFVHQQLPPEVRCGATIAFSIEPNRLGA